MFKFLIGRLRHLPEEISKIEEVMFKFLIGRLRPRREYEWDFSRRVRFKFLIGRLRHL